MTHVARYIIVLDRFDDDDWAAAQIAGGGHDGTAQAAIEQVAGELQEAMNQTGSPAGFFNVIDRRIVERDRAVTVVDARQAADDLGIERKLEDDPA